MEKEKVDGPSLCGCLQICRLEPCDAIWQDGAFMDAKNCEFIGKWPLMAYYALGYRDPSVGTRYKERKREIRKGAGKERNR